jgi:hypothetical protein
MGTRRHRSPSGESQARQKHAPLIWALAVLLLFGCNMREDELECEEAVAHLASCCPGFNTRGLNCSYETRSGCTESTYYPVFGIDESKTIRAASCDALITSGGCATAQQAMRPSTTRGGGL